MTEDRTAAVVPFDLARAEREARADAAADRGRDGQAGADVWGRYQEGELDAEAALRLLLHRYREVDRRYRALEGEKQRLRERLAAVHAAGGGRPIVYAGYEVRALEAGRTVTYDARGLDQLLETLVAAGDLALAARLAEYRKEGTRAGGLRIAALPAAGAAPAVAS